MNFTVYNDKRINEKIQSDLSLIQERLYQEFQSIEALILVGSFGRGEGGVLIENGIIKPINDYDIVMITNQKIDRSKLSTINRKLAKEIDIYFVDVVAPTKNRLRWLRSSIFSYDMKYGGYVFAGDRNILSLIREMRPEKIPLIEFEIQFFTRIGCFLVSFCTDFLKRPLTVDEKFLLVNQMSKAVLTCMDALLIMRGYYHHSYLKRRRSFCNLYRGEKELITHINFATEFKIKPTKTIDFDPVNYYFDVKKLFEFTFLKFVRFFYNRNFQDLVEYSKFYPRKVERVVKRILYILVKRSMLYEKRLNIDVAQIVLLEVLKRELIDRQKTLKVKNILEKLFESNICYNDWDDLKNLVINERDEVYSK